MVRKIKAYKNYFHKFYKKLNKIEKAKLNTALDLLQMNQEFKLRKLVLPVVDIKGVYELRTQYGNNELRVYFVYEDKNIIFLFNGIRKKDQKIKKKDLDKIKLIKKHYDTEKKHKKK
ncbi:addiction module toxin RelE [Candidatus Campbellbacteria bacterium]|nr:MAG: addiction module toxin RelE [Candidatus Campbellbacteria bacterium]